MIFAVPGKVTKLSTLGDGGVAITFHVPPSDAEQAYKVGKFVDQHTTLELRRRGLD